jgi:hypothetical protein
MFTLMVKRVEDVFLSIFCWQKSLPKTQHFFLEKYPPLLPRFIKNASVHVYTFSSSLSISIRYLVGLLMISGAIIIQIIMVEIFESQKVVRIN